MSPNKFEDKFLDYIENTLSPAERAEFEQALNADEALKNSFDAYQAIMQLEAEVKAPDALNKNFDAKLMQRIDLGNYSFFERLYMEVVRSRQMLVGSLVTVATLVIVINISKESMQQMPTPSISLPQIRVEAPLPKQGADSTKKEMITADQQLSPVGRIVKDSGGIISGNKPTEGLKNNRTTTILPQSNVISDSKVLNLEKNKVGLSRDGPRHDIAAKSLKGEATGSMLPQSSIDTDSNLGRRERKQLGIRGNATELDQELREYAKPSSPISASKIRVDDLSAHIPYQTSNTERYNSYNENKRISTLTEPISTFSIDVDTGSYTNARRFLSQGILPPRDAVRVEEFINYFDYDYPLQHEKPFNLSYEVAPSPFNSKVLLLKLGIKAKDIKQSDKPWNLVFLVDVSGSMSDPNKLELVKRSLKILVQQMQEKDRIALVTYAGNAGLALDSAEKKDQAKILSAIEALGASGSTNGAGGINMAYDVAKKHFIKGGVNRVILATDGDFNVGVSNQSELIKLIEEKRESGITLTTVGVGAANIQEGTMEQLANKGNGNYFYLDSFDEARKVFETDLMGTIEVVAKDVKLQIEFNPSHVAQYRLIGYENRALAKEDFNNDKIDAGEIGAGHTVTALYELILSGSELAKELSVESRYQKPAEVKQEIPPTLSSELAFLKIRFKEPEGSTSQLLNFPIEKNTIEDSSATSADFRFSSAVGMFAELLRGGVFTGTTSFSDVIKVAETGKSADKNGYRQGFIELVKNAKAISAR